MMVKCVKRYVCPNKPVTSDGCRFKFFYPNGGSYSGYWLKNQNHGFGAKISEERNCRYYANKKRPVGQLIYKGDWKQDKRTNSGSMIRKRGTDLETIYTGMWYDDQKVAEGIKYYTDGCVYYGEWLRNCRHGMGILWYVDGSIYLGEWKTDYKHGLGVLFYANGNRYEGHFARGYKNGEGIFYHMHTGQVQKGIWHNDNAKVSVMQDEPDIRRNDKVTPFPIPSNQLKYPNEIMRNLFQQYHHYGKKEPRPFNDRVTLEFIHHHRQFASFEERLNSPSKLDLYPNIKFVCTCDCQILYEISNPKCKI